MSTTVSYILDCIDRIAPFNTAESWDNIGLLIGNGNQPVSKILLSLDITDEVICEAIDKGVQLIITHHPIIFRGIKSVTTSDRIGAMVLKLIENKISVIAAHTNLDRSFDYGINRHIANLYGLSNIQTLSDMHGFGIIGCFDTPVSITTFTELTKEVFQTNVIKFANHSNDAVISRIAISSGASSEYIGDALTADVDVFITSDLKYHEAQNVLGTKLILVDVGHFESEFLYLNRFIELLKHAVNSTGNTIDFFVTATEKPIFNYL